MISISAQHTFRFNQDKPELIDLAMEPLNAEALRQLHASRMYSILLVNRGAIKLEISNHIRSIASPALVFLSQYQPYRIQGFSASTEGILLQFSSDFYCIHLHHKEVACDGVLFHTVFDPPQFALNAPESTKLKQAWIDLIEEFSRPEKDAEMLFTLLKLVLKQAARIRNQEEQVNAAVSTMPEALLQLKNLLEESFRNRLSASDYAEKLNMRPERLNRLVKNHTGLTLSALIQERVMAEARRELYLTEKPVRQIAAELGFDDPFYFSRLFKNVSTVSPETYRTNTRMQAHP